MTLQRSQLLPSSLCDIAATALAGQGQYGVVTQIAREYDVSRQMVYRIRDTGHQALQAAFESPVPSTWSVEVPEAAVQRSIVSLYTASPLSIDDIVEQLPILYGGLKRSHGYIWNVIQTAQKNALAFLDGLDLSGIDAIALDEMFWHHQPLLTGIDLDSGLWFSAEKVRHRSGPEWVSRLTTLQQQGLDPEVVLKDAGAAMAEACTAVFPGAEQRDDLFHAVALLRELGEVLDNLAYRAIGAFDTADRKYIRAKDTQERRQRKRTRTARETEMTEAIARADRFEPVRRQVEGLLSLCSPATPRLRRAEEVRTQLPVLAAEIAELGGKRAEKLSRYLTNRVEGLSSYLEKLETALAACGQSLASDALVGAVVWAYQAGLWAGRGRRWEREAGQKELTAAVEHLVAISDGPERLVAALEVVVPVLERRHRASSAIENVHSVLRPYIAVHKGISQGFLDLLRFYWNTRIRRWGRHKGTSPLQVLTGQKHADWLTLLGFPPATTAS